MAYIRQIKIALVVVGFVLLGFVVIRYRRKSTDPDDDDEALLVESESHEITGDGSNG
jgi:hypothetical protein